MGKLEEKGAVSRNGQAEWKGNLIQGSGRLKVGSGAFEGPYSFKSRVEDGQSATNPEELLCAAHAGCFTMARPPSFHAHASRQPGSTRGRG